MRWPLKSYIYLVVIALIALFIWTETQKKSSNTVKQSVVLIHNGTEYIPRNRIIFPPLGSINPEVKYPNGKIKSGAFTPPVANLIAPELNTTFASIPHKYVTQPGLTLQRDEEGFESCPYFDPYGGVWTIGIGEAYVSPNRPCESEYTAYRNLEWQDAERYSWPIWDLNTYFNHNQFDALIDFDYNLGPYIFQISPSITYYLEHREFYTAWDIMDGYDKAGGVVLGDLYRRRLAERALFFRYEPPEETPAQRKIREEKELAGHKYELKKLAQQRSDIQRQLVVWGCRHRERYHENLGPKCKGAEGAGQRVDAHENYEIYEIHKLEKELA